MAGAIKPSSSEMSIRERRLRPIYDLLDASSNKRVIQEVDRLLKKQPNFTCAKVLKALALLRINKQQECLAIISPIFDEVPLEDNTLQALSICYRELDQPEMVCKLFENVCKTDKSEDMMTYSFLAYVRVGDFQNQYEAAMALYRMYKKGPYFCWAVMSLVVKALHESDQYAAHFCLALAERMMSKFIMDYNIGTDKEISLYLLVLRKQKSYAKLLELIENIVKPTISSITGLCHQLKLECLQETHQIEILAQHLENSIMGSPNEWQFYSEYLSLLDSIGELRVERFLLKVLDMYRSEIPPKSTLLAFLSLYDILAAKDFPNEELLAPVELYIKHYGHKASCFMDMSPFLTSLPSSDFKRSILSAPCAQPPSEYFDVNELRRQVNYLHLTRFLVMEDELDGLKTLEFCQQLLKRYFEAKSIIGEAELAECSTHAELITLAALSLLDSFWTNSDSWIGIFKTGNNKSSLSDENSLDPSECTSSDDPVAELEVNAITNGLNCARIQEKYQVMENDFPVLICGAVLTYAMENCPPNSQIKIILSKLYIRCGAVAAGLEILKKLDLKYIQNESVGYLYLWKLVPAGLLSEGFRILKSVENFYTSYQKESLENVLSAYKYGAWARVLEFNEFRKSMLNSLQSHLVKVERVLLEYCKDACSHNQTLQIAQKGIFDINHVQWNNLSDGRDLRAVRNYRPTPNRKKLKEITMNAEKYRLKVRGLLLLLLNDAVHIMMDENSLSIKVASLTETIVRLQEQLKVDCSEFELNDMISIDGMWPPRISKYVKSGYVDFLSIYFELLCITVSEPTSPKLSETVTKITKFLNVTIIEEIQALEPKRRSLFQISEFIETMFDLIETLSFTCVIMDVIGFIINKGLTLTEGKKKKKGKTVCVDPVHAQYFADLQSGLRNCLTNLNHQVNRLIAMFNMEDTNWDNISTFWCDKIGQELLQILPSALPTVLTQLHESYSKSFEEMSITIKSKLKYLNTLSVQALR